MSVFPPMSPARAVALVEAAGVTGAAEKICDFAAAGIVRSEALLVETIEVDGQRTSDDSGKVPIEIWQRVVREGLKPQDWIGGTLRIQGDVLIGGKPEVVITGLRFVTMDLHRLIRFHRGDPPAIVVPPKVMPPVVPPSTPTAKRRTRTPPDHSIIRPGALLLTIAEAGAVLGFKRTKVNRLINAKLLDRVEVGGAPRITVASVRALAGIT